jgi:GT2 family glycosyltransferase
MNRKGASIIIINYNGLRFLPELFSSIREQTLEPAEILLVDNGSTDGSPGFVEENYPGTRIIRMPGNLGFAAAANAGLEASRFEASAIVNTDIKLERNWLEKLASALESDERIGAVAAKIMLYDRPGLLNGVGGGMNRLGYTWDLGMFEEDSGQYDDPAEVIFAPASAAMFRKSAVLSSGGFDESFFMYHEDVDLGWRLWLLGFRIITCPEAVALHHFGGSTKESRSMIWRELQGERNNMTSLLKNYELLNAVRFLVEVMLLKQQPSRKAGQVKNFLWNLLKLPATLKKRRFIQKHRKLSDDEITRLIVQSRHVPIRL